MFLFILCSELPAIQEIPKIGGCKNWKGKEKMEQGSRSPA